MATVLKSNSVAGKYLLSGLQLTVPSDFKSKLDFTSGKYVLNGVESTLSQAVTTIRGSAAGYLDDTGTYKTAAVNAARIHNDPYAGKGLLAESGCTNVLNNPSAPVNQSVSMNATPANFVVLQVWGTGSVALSINGVALGSATQAIPLVIVPTATGNQTANVVITGAISHFQLFVSGSPQVRQTKFAGAVAADVHTFRPNLANPKRGTVIIKRAEIKWLNNALVGARVFNIVQLLNPVSGLFSLGNQKAIASPKKAYYAHITNDNTGIAPAAFGISLDKEVIAITYDIDAKTMKIMENGAITNVTLPNFTDTSGFDRYILGSTALQYWPTFCQLIKEVYVYDRVLSDAEMLALI